MTLAHKAAALTQEVRGVIAPSGSRYYDPGSDRPGPPAH
jgi:hypothetical protein